MDESIHISLLLKIGDGFLAAPYGPVVAGELHSKAITKQVDGLIDLIGPGQRIPKLSTSWRIYIVQVVRSYLRHTQCFELRKVEDELGGCFASHRHLKLDINTIDMPRFTGVLNDVVRYHKACRSHRQSRTQPTADKAGWRCFKQVAIHVRCTPAHDITGKHVLGECFTDEVPGRDDFDIAARYLLLAYNSEHATKVIPMAVSEDDTLHGTLTQVAVG